MPRAYRMYICPWRLNNNYRFSVLRSVSKKVEIRDGIAKLQNEVSSSFRKLDERQSRMPDLAYCPIGQIRGFHTPVPFLLATGNWRRTCPIQVRRLLK